MTAPLHGPAWPAGDPRLAAEAREHPYPLLFVTVSGAHLYGFPSSDSDFDLRGSHVLPADDCLGLDDPAWTVTLEHGRDGAEVDLVTHDLRKFATLLLGNNGYVLEQLYSPLIVLTTPAHGELKEIARGCITRGCCRHYLGFARGQWGKFERESVRRVKTLLYVYRVLLTGIHLMRTGEVNAHLLACNEAREEPLTFLPALVARKAQGKEKGALSGDDFNFHRAEVAELAAELEASALASPLPAEPTVKAELNDLLLRVRRELGGAP
jgi:hypothetical protein